MNVLDPDVPQSAGVLKTVESIKIFSHKIKCINKNFPQQCEVKMTGQSISVKDKLLIKPVIYSFLLTTEFLFETFGPHCTFVCSCICIHLMYILHHPSTCENNSEKQQGETTCSPSTTRWSTHSLELAMQKNLKAFSYSDTVKKKNNHKNTNPQNKQTNERTGRTAETPQDLLEWPATAELDICEE